MESRKTVQNKKISFIGLGCWRFGEPESHEQTDNPGISYWGGQKRKDSIRTIDAAVRGGITHFDTAQSYGRGKSEQITGQRLRKYRENTVIATKIMIDRFSTGYIDKKVELSLKRLNTDYIDILYIHWPSDTETMKRTVNSLENIRKSEKIRFIGVSNFSVSDMKTALKEGQIDFHQTAYSLLWREEEKEVIPFCVKNNISVIAYSFFAQGLLTSQALESIGDKVNDRRGDLVFFKGNNRNILINTLDKLNTIAEKSSYTVPELLIGWGKSKPWLGSILIGAKNRNQIDKVLESECLTIEKSLINKLDDLSAEINFFSREKNIFSHTTRQQDC